MVFRQLNRFIKELPDVIFMDVQMPPDGWSGGNKQNRIYKQLETKNI